MGRNGRMPEAPDGVWSLLPQRNFKVWVAWAMAFLAFSTGHFQ